MEKLNSTDAQWVQLANAIKCNTSKQAQEKDYRTNVIFRLNEMSEIDLVSSGFVKIGSHIDNPSIVQYEYKGSFGVRLFVNKNKDNMSSYVCQVPLKNEQGQALNAKTGTWE